MQVVEHLVLKVGGFVGNKYKTKYHDDLGDDLQKALEVLELEGWDYLYQNLGTGAAEVILKRKPR